MITYELAKQLKDGGFKQNGMGGLFCFNKFEISTKPHHYFYESFQLFICLLGGNDIPEYIYIPTLSELIEACGGSFGILERTRNGWAAMTPDITSQVQLDNPNAKITRAVDIYASGSNPEEAVARLWLSINKK
jgi:hypothetical protein